MSGLSVRLEQAGPIPLAVAFGAAPGELLALFGPSGSGKSTILRAIAGLYRPRSGHITANGAVWFDAARDRFLPPWQRRVGLVFQSYALFPHLSALGNVMVALGHLPRAARRRRAEELLEQVHLAALAERRPATLSGGEQQRVALARALAREPHVLLLDEPFSAVDRSRRESLYRELAHIRHRLAIPAVLVTHDLEEARLLADRICLLDHGRILQDGPPAEVVARPVSAAAARTVGHRNILPGRLVRDPGSGARIAWRDRLLAAEVPRSIPDGAAVDWTIAPHAVELVSSGAGDATGTVIERLRLGETDILRLALGPDDATLTVHLPAAAAHEAPPPGTRIACRFPAAAIHVMLRNELPGTDAVDDDGGGMDETGARNARIS